MFEIILGIIDIMPTAAVFEILLPTQRTAHTRCPGIVGRRDDGGGGRERAARAEREQQSEIDEHCLSHNF